MMWKVFLKTLLPMLLLTSICEFEPATEMAALCLFLYILDLLNFAQLLMRYFTCFQYMTCGNENITSLQWMASGMGFLGRDFQTGMDWHLAPIFLDFFFRKSRLWKCSLGMGKLDWQSWAECIIKWPSVELNNASNHHCHGIVQKWKVRRDSVRGFEIYPVMESSDDQSTFHGKETQDNERTLQGLESDLAPEKNLGPAQMSVVHGGAFIITICMAQILALSGLGQGLGMFNPLPWNTCRLTTLQLPCILSGTVSEWQTKRQLTWYLAAFSLTVGTSSSQPVF